MNYKQKGIQAVGLFAAVATTMALIVPTVNSQSKTIKIDGSSTVYPITEAVAEEYQITNRGATQVTVGISGTGGGFKKFCSTDDSVRTDISNASRPIKDKEKETCAAAGIEYIEIPVAYDAIAVVVNKDNPVSTITTEQLNAIWAPEADGTVTTWGQVDPSWGDTKLELYGPGADSGTFDYFTKKINGESGASRADYTPSEDDNVLVQGVAGGQGAMGYFGLSYYFENQDKIKALGIDSGDGAVYPTSETVIDGTYTPLSRPIFIYVNKASLDKPEVAEFVQFYLENAEELVPETGSVPLAASGSGLSYNSSMEVLKSSL
ncbi:phosphate binding protein [Xenococcus sp. PCC 7305]|uniref:PstS family phosphate ABC transporter substrate-binding protein n=1 Tax=Xenococcus sp. PCC 7305 TaxID=102125 RepID=UPI0002ACCED2|nr:PstS family phosphate ABC transporter substrate-binding protein [Xenococcus sp. PCC 7305]ELS01762.1 phosphate binding protein [Xenococcus sp. PCC 7305]